jgi:hypothetical protein
MFAQKALHSGVPTTLEQLDPEQAPGPAPPSLPGESLLPQPIASIAKRSIVLRMSMFMRRAAASNGKRKMLLTAAGAALRRRRQDPLVARGAVRWGCPSQRCREECTAAPSSAEPLPPVA